MSYRNKTNRPGCATQRILVGLVFLSMMGSLLGCGETSKPVGNTTEAAPGEATDVGTEDNIVATYEEHLHQGLKPDGGEMFALEDTTIVESDETEVVDLDTVDGTYEITAGGAYRLRGKSTSAKLSVQVPKDESVSLIFDGATLYGTEPLIDIISGDCVYFQLEEGSENYINSGAANEGAKPQPLIYSDVDLVFLGTGMLDVNAKYGTAIECRKDVSITGGQVFVKAGDMGIIAKDSFRMADGVLHINASDDGIQISNDKDAHKGFFYMEGGTLQISCGDDAVHAEHFFAMRGGTYDITESREGVEARFVNIWDGKLGLHAVDDGINASGKGGEKPYIHMSGGELYVNSLGDGLDSNGTFYMDGGKVYVEAPIHEGDDSLDRDMPIEFHDGYLLATTSAETAIPPTVGSYMGCRQYDLGNVPGEGKPISLRDEHGDELAGFIPERPYVSILVFLPEDQNPPELLVGEKSLEAKKS